MEIAVVILNWNGEKLLEKFLPSVVKYSENQATVYVADNNSTDGSIDFLKKNYPTIKIVQNAKNGGYAKGYNDALKKIKADVYALVNSDIEVTENWLEPISETFKKFPDTAAIQPKLLDYKDKIKFEYAGAGGGFVDFMGYPYCKGRIFNELEIDHGQFDSTYPIFWGSGACLFIRSEVYHKMHGLDENYFSHQEEIDLCWRIQNEGYQILYVGASRVYHVGGATLQESNPHKTFLNFRNSLFTISKNVPKRYVFFVVLMRLILDGVAALKFAFELRPVHSFAILKSHLSFYYYLPKMLHKRRYISFKQTRYFDCFSIVWQHFVLRKKTYKELHQ